MTHYGLINSPANFAATDLTDKYNGMEVNVEICKRIDGAMEYSFDRQHVLAEILSYNTAGQCLLGQASGALNHTFLLTRPGYHIKAEVAFCDVDPSEYAGLFVSGGRAPECLRYDKDLLRITRHVFEANKPVAVVCHRLEIVSAAGVIRGRTVTTVAKCALDCLQGGGNYVDQPVVIDGNLVTARTWHDNTPFMGEFMKMLVASRGK